MNRIWLLAEGAILLLSPSAFAACRPADIELLQATYHLIGTGYVRVVGELKNNCPEPTGIQLKIVWRDAKGEVVDTDEFWPASIRNIGAGSKYAFSSTQRVDLSHVKTLSLSVIDVRRF